MLVRTRSRLLQDNQFSPANNPNAGFFAFGENGLTSDYDSLQVQFRRRLSRGLTALGFLHVVSLY